MMLDKVRAQRVNHLTLVGSSVLMLGMMGVQAEAGSFVFVDETFPDTVAHPPNYDPTVGGVVTVSVCIDPAAADATAIVIPVKNVVEIINNLSPESPNLILGGDNNIPAGKIDFESLTLHELGHCIGLGHPNLGFRTGVVEGAKTDYTQSEDGNNNAFSFSEIPAVDSDGADDVIGSSDDNRSDDVNLHWFVDNVDNPFLSPPAVIDGTNYTRDVADLPARSNFPANAERDVGALLGFPDTEAVMQQGQGFDEDQRALQADDVATLSFAMTGLDEIAGTSDDYTINMVYVGLTASCDIVVRSVSTGFGACSLSGVLTDPTFTNLDHITITNAEFTYNSTRGDWFFNDVLNSACSAGIDDLPVSGSDTGIADHEACNSIAFSDYSSSGTVTATAPTIEVQNNVTIGGTFTANSAVP